MHPSNRLHTSRGAPGDSCQSACCCGTLSTESDAPVCHWGLAWTLHWGEGGRHDESRSWLRLMPRSVPVKLEMRTYFLSYLDR